MDKINNYMEEITALKTEKAQNESTINFQEESIQTIQRELSNKVK
jgi:hypothetical protein